jgi:hypothetical protein
MFHLEEQMRYYLYPYPADMRKGFYTLSGIVTNSTKDRRMVPSPTADVYIWKCWKRERKHDLRTV